MNKSIVTIDKLKKVFESKKYKFFENDTKNYNLNIIGIRSKDLTPNSFNDLLCVCWKYKGVWTIKLYDCTTDPGLYYLLKPMNTNGTAIVVPGQYINNQQQQHFLPLQHCSLGDKHQLDLRLNPV